MREKAKFPHEVLRTRNPNQKQTAGVNRPMSPRAGYAPKHRGASHVRDRHGLRRPKGEMRKRQAESRFPVQRDLGW